MSGGRRAERESVTDNDSDDLIHLLGNVLDRACELIASPNGHLCEALERVEAACARPRANLRARKPTSVD